jgi:4-methyl-5(b-hydroxyethyl)-thiazole monophosphate biosynthesis
MPTVLVPLADGFEEIEALAPIDLLRRAGIGVTTASLAPHGRATGRSDIVVQTDRTLTDALHVEYDLVFLPGGAGTRFLRADARIRELVLKQHAADRWLAAICAAPTVLNDCGLLAGRRYTAHYSVAAELPLILANEKVVTDGKITTSRGAGTAVEFGLHLVSLLADKSKSEEISKAICL